MTSTLNPALCAALIAALPFVVAFFAAMLRDISQARRERAGGVLATCMGLGLTENHLIVGNRENARQIPLTRLTVNVESGGAGHGSAVRLAVRGAGELIEREEPYSYAASGEAQIFATMLTRLSQSLQPPGMNSVPAGV